MTEDIIARNEECQLNDENKKKPKPPGVFGFFKAAMLVLRHRTKAKRKAAQVALRRDWKKLVGSMRPLHLQDQNDNNNNNNNINNTLPCVTSPSSASGTMSQYASANDLKSLDDTYSDVKSSGSMSQYASANNLQELDEQEDDPDQAFDAIGADDMIDAKAELFILQFYQQMRRQNIDSISGQFN